MPLKPFLPNYSADKKIFLLKPRGFCAGVVRAIDVVKIALDLYGPPVYVRKEKGDPDRDLSGSSCQTSDPALCFTGRTASGSSLTAIPGDSTVESEASGTGPVLTG